MNVYLCFANASVTMNGRVEGSAAETHILYMRGGEFTGVAVDLKVK